MSPFSVEEAYGLTADQLEAISTLEHRVLDRDGGRLKLEWGVLLQRPPDELNDLLVWDGDTLCGFCGIYAFGREPELVIVVDPLYRRRGIGAALLGRARSLLGARGHRSLLLVAPRMTDSGRRFAEAVGASFDHAEHHMELAGEPTRPPPVRASTKNLVIRPFVKSDRAEVVAILEDAFGRGSAAIATDPHDLAFVVEQDDAVVATLRLSVEGVTAGIYGLAVRRELRGRGIGRAVLSRTCLEARRRGATTVTLEVEVDNDHALHLYTSVGFARRTTEDYFKLTFCPSPQRPPRSTDACHPNRCGSRWRAT
jgi:ribosomal protein S18 acetylase RimI-like enzyme